MNVFESLGRRAPSIAMALVFPIVVLTVLALLWSPPGWSGNVSVFEKEPATEIPGRCVATKVFPAFHVFPTEESAKSSPRNSDLVATPPQNVNDATKQAFTCNEWAGRVLLHPVGEGAEVSTNDVGPKNVQDGSEVVTVRVITPLNAVSAGDVVDLLIEPAKDAATPTPSARGATPVSAPSASRRIVDATVLVVGEASDEDLLPVIVAVPPQPASNRTIVERVERDSTFTVVYTIESTPTPTPPT